ncbi:hypothetical protein H6G89_32560 [Oscillatoria sp. FACHB-1407]|uniref:hypothetical protein n=1 Tax=Oscillatoria sp. FACHB-1407 TaxID=2692847 RepID=UPI001689CB87|nr:hypothetical protein [Oscillatoria sp. FACHB-1407]MBD2465722.1 hypothetical protein [Oscillatoria sp. FACHB-1407]
MADKFPTAYYEAHNIPTCPNGDKVRSDEEGLFCWVEGARVPALVTGGQVVLQPVSTVPEPLVEPAKTPIPAKAKAKGEPTDANG